MYFFYFISRNKVLLLVSPFKIHDELKNTKEINPFSKRDLQKLIRDDDQEIYRYTVIVMYG